MKSGCRKGYRSQKSYLTSVDYYKWEFHNWFLKKSTWKTNGWGKFKPRRARKRTQMSMNIRTKKWHLRSLGNYQGYKEAKAALSPASLQCLSFLSLALLCSRAAPTARMWLLRGHRWPGHEARESPGDGAGHVRSRSCQNSPGCAPPSWDEALSWNLQSGSSGFHPYD